MGLFPALPVRGHQDTTLNFEKLQREVGADWTNPETFSVKLEATTSCQTRREWFRTVVRLRGTVKAKEAIPAGTTLFILPAGFRPSGFVRGTVQEISAGNLQLGLIRETGVVELPNYEIPIGHFVGFDSMTFNLT